MKLLGSDVLSLGAIALGGLISISATAALRASHHVHEHVHIVDHRVEAPEPVLAPTPPQAPVRHVPLEIRVRGNDHSADEHLHLDAELEPIVFVDGIRMEGAAVISELSPDGIDRIEVIKGDAAAAAYGEEARARGVVHIFLKSEKPGG